MGFLDSLHRANIVNDPASQFDRTNIGSGILQARAAITQALSEDNPFLASMEFPAIALWVSEPSLVTSMNDASSPVLPQSSALSTAPSFTYAPTMKIKIYFRVPILHSNIPLPSKFSSEAKNSLSKLNPEDRDALLISCHPFLYADFEEFSGINAGDQIEIRFDDKSYSSAKIIKSEKKGPNNIGSDNNLAAGFAGISNFVFSITDLFDDEAEVAILGSPDEKKYTNVIYELEDGLGKVGNIIETAGWPMTTSAVDAEYKRWQKGALKETDPGAYPYLKEYWDNIGITEWTPAGTPWSAAFISFLLKSSGFPGASSHRSYTKKIIERDTPWSAYSVPKNKGRIKVGIGDVVVAARGDGSEDDYKKTHGDVVYKIEASSSGFKAYTAGGNLGNTAKDGTPLSLDGEKNLLNAGKYVVILKYGRLITV